MEQNRLRFETEIKHICLLSGGHSSAIVSIEVVNKFGKENCILVNHDISSWVEDSDIKRFKTQISYYLEIPITYVNYKNSNSGNLPTQFDIARIKKGFKAPGTDDAFCTYELKTKPFMDWLAKEFPDQNVVIYYGFDSDEGARIAKREYVLGQLGYDVDFPIARWEKRTLNTTIDIGIIPPLSYSVMKHANCVGCLKAGQKHWYVVFVTRKDVWKEAKETEVYTGYSILKASVAINGKKTSRPLFLEELEPIFDRMEAAGVPATEHMTDAEFKKYKKKYKCPDEFMNHKPCDCLI